MRLNPNSLRPRVKLLLLLFMPVAFAIVTVTSHLPRRYQLMKSNVVTLAKITRFDSDDHKRVCFEFSVAAKTYADCSGGYELKGNVFGVNVFYDPADPTNHSIVEPKQNFYRTLYTALATSVALPLLIFLRLTIRGSRRVPRRKD